LFRVYRSADSDDSFTKIYVQAHKESALNLRYILQQEQAFFNDKVFELKGLKNGKFRFVQIKIKTVQSKLTNEQKVLLQVIDISDKMLYNEVKAEKSFLTLISATVSHELRNPLQSLLV
jgi:nitrogen-specific signal transduction histidine kinase